MNVFRILVFLGLISLHLNTLAEQVGTEFTYQGELKYLNEPANGNFDFEFELYAVESVGEPIAGTVFKPNVLVAEGIFTVELDFGPEPFSTGQQLWLGISVHQSGSVDPHVLLAPRQKLTASPYAIASLQNVGSLQPYLYDSEGQRIGLYLGDVIPQWDWSNAEKNYPLAQIVTDDGYLAWIMWSSGGLFTPEFFRNVRNQDSSNNREVYTNQECSGQAYVAVESVDATWAFRGGLLVGLGSGKLGKTGVTKSNIQYESYLSSTGACTIVLQTPFSAVEIEAFVDPADYNMDEEMKFKIPLQIRME